MIGSQTEDYLFIINLNFPFLSTGCICGRVEVRPVYVRYMTPHACRNLRLCLLLTLMVLAMLRTDAVISVCELDDCATIEKVDLFFYTCDACWFSSLF